MFWILLFRKDHCFCRREELVAEANMDEGGLSDFCIKGGGIKCGRWNPTGEQVKVLMDLFKAGLRTPSAEQIQNISYELSFYGKIESKNVFYWFQNHKARERQKRRRVSIEKKDAEKQEKQKIANTAFPEVNTEQEKVIKTLQLFPLKSYEESEAETFRYVRIGTSRESTFSSFGASLFSTSIDPLDLRLSS